MLTVSPHALQLPRGKDEWHAQSIDRAVEYYSSAGPDFAMWSRKFNMHFGYYEQGMNPLRLEPMLERMNARVTDELGLPSQGSKLLLDMGCGLGATARYIARNYQDSFINCVTCVPWQIEHGRELTAEVNLHRKVVFFLADFADTPFSDGLFDGLYAIESSRYARGSDKGEFLKEAFRLLKPGSRIALTDGFLKDAANIDPLTQLLYAKSCEAWAIDEFADIDVFAAMMDEAGFEDIRIEELSWKIAPSVAHVPVTALKFLYKALVEDRNSLRGSRLGHLTAPIYGALLGLRRNRFGYFLVSARKPEFFSK